MGSGVSSRSGLGRQLQDWARASAQEWALAWVLALKDTYKHRNSSTRSIVRFMLARTSAQEWALAWVLALKGFSHTWELLDEIDCSIHVGPSIGSRCGLERRLRSGLGRRLIRSKLRRGFWLKKVTHAHGNSSTRSIVRYMWARASAPDVG